ncbi:unnamed protein product [Paramecium octaurelia]|uniref:Uncharacterized protein n=1 Tax=Paramecium octaurelia TaxID=43137 RepID=A0A8S1Y2Z3_PAROT|nr:unnamed protein product [Paramecium octaurelia]
MINKKYKDNKNSSTKQKLNQICQLIKNDSQIQDQVFKFWQKQVLIQRGSLNNNYKSRKHNDIILILHIILTCENELNFLEGLNSQRGYLREQKNILIEKSRGNILRYSPANLINYGKILSQLILKRLELGRMAQHFISLFQPIRQFLVYFNTKTF